MRNKLNKSAIKLVNDKEISFLYSKQWKDVARLKLKYLQKTLQNFLLPLSLLKISSEGDIVEGREKELVKISIKQQKAINSRIKVTQAAVYIFSSFWRL